MIRALSTSCTERRCWTEQGFAVFDSPCFVSFCLDDARVFWVSRYMWYIEKAEEGTSQCEREQGEGLSAP